MISTIPFKRGGAVAARRVHNPEVARAIRALASILACAALAACAPAQVRHVPVPLPLAARPVLTPIAADAFTCPVALPPPYTMCISDATYTALVGRERAYKAWGLQLEAIISANNAKANGGK